MLWLEVGLDLAGGEDFRPPEAEMVSRGGLPGPDAIEAEYPWPPR